MIKCKINKIKFNYFEEYSKIEIELFLIEKASGKFINIDEENKPYYHIYFNDEKEEIKKYDINEQDKVNKIKIIIDFQVKTFNGLFEDCKCIKSINFIKFKRNNINNMSKMFNRCTSLKKINFSKFNTDKTIFLILILKMLKICALCLVVVLL